MTATGSSSQNLIKTLAARREGASRCRFYFEANERFPQAAGDPIDGYFFGNDFGTQQDLIVSPSHEALLPNIPPQNIAAMAEAALG